RFHLISPSDSVSFLSSPLPPPPRSTLFPYTTLFRSHLIHARQRHRAVGADPHHAPECRGVGIACVPGEHIQARLVSHARRCRGTPRPGLILVLQRVRGEDTVDLHAVGDPGLLEAVGPEPPRAIRTHTVDGGERVLPAREAADQPAAASRMSSRTSWFLLLSQ